MGNLRTNGASEEEIAFMFSDFDRLRSTRRVELNAMTSPHLIRQLELDWSPGLLHLCIVICPETGSCDGYHERHNDSSGPLQDGT
jgi:hypothetical protein